MTTKGAVRFVSDSGADVSVRVSTGISSDTVLVEPLYATDVDLLDGARGELHGLGETLRGTLRRRGGAFVLIPEQPRAERPAKAALPVQAPAPVLPPAAAQAKAERSPEIQTTPLTDEDEAMEAASTLAHFVKGDRGVRLQAARRAHAVLGHYIAERERQRQNRSRG